MELSKELIGQITRLVTQEIKKQDIFRYDENVQDNITLNQAIKVIEKIETKASSMGINVVIAISNKLGHPIAVHVMDDAYIASYDIAVNKAFTCASLKMTTEQLGQLAGPGQSLYGIQFTNQGRIVIFGGGTPLYYNQKIIGALGVSGGSAEEDTFLANYGAEIAKEVLG